MKHSLWAALLIGLASVQPATGALQAEPTAFERLVPRESKPVPVASGFKWAEGPIWIPDGGYLLFSDVPNNRIHRWSEGVGASIFLEPSGGMETEGFREPGSNGLKLGPSGSILMADQGNRAIALLNLKTRGKRLLIERYAGKRLNSPNDVAVGPDGSIWFTDPPYGLEGLNASPLKEQDANGVYRLAPNGRVTRIDPRLTFPNGLAFAPDGRTLYVSNSDPKNPVIMAYRLGLDSRVLSRRLFADFSAGVKAGGPGLPDGMTLDEDGNLWATGPGGVHVLSPNGRELGLVAHDKAVSNCAFGGPDGRTLFMTASDRVLALRTNARGAPARMPKIRSRRDRP
jgi:gluconolactonase